MRNEIHALDPQLAIFNEKTIEAHLSDAMILPRVSAAMFGFFGLAGEDLPAAKVIPIMLGDLQRIWIYGRRGWSAAQIVPPEVMEAYRELKALGFTQQLLQED